MLNFDDHGAIERAAEFTYMEQGLPSLGDMPTLEAYKLGFVAGMRLAGEEILKLAQDRKWVAVEVPVAGQELSAERVAAIARAMAVLQEAGCGDVRLLARGNELRLGWD